MRHSRSRPLPRLRQLQPITVISLSGSKHYHCRVKATNAIGAGPYGS
jgi:hypothetical protein